MKSLMFCFVVLIGCFLERGAAAQSSVPGSVPGSGLPGSWGSSSGWFGRVVKPKSEKDENLEGFGSNSPAERKEALDVAMGAAYSDSVRRRVQGLIRDPLPEIRQEAAQLLGQWANEYSLIPLRAQQERESVHEVYDEIANSITRIEQSCIISRIESRDRLEILRAVEELSKMAHNPGWATDQLLLVARQNSEPYIRQKAVRLLAELGMEAVIPDLERIAQNPLESKDMAKTASFAVDRILFIAGYKLVKSSEPSIRIDGVEVWVKLSQKYASGVVWLAELLRNDPSPAVRARIAYELGELRKREAYPGLREVLTDQDECSFVRKAAKDALDKIRAKNPDLPEISVVFVTEPAVAPAQTGEK